MKAEGRQTWWGTESLGELGVGGRVRSLVVVLEKWVALIREVNLTRLAFRKVDFSQRKAGRRFRRRLFIFPLIKIIFEKILNRFITEHFFTMVHDYLTQSLKEGGEKHINCTILSILKCTVQ